MKKYFIAIVAAVVTVGVAVTAGYAAVTFDPATGNGFVGKGDVQLAFGWNNAQLQKNASGVSFQYQSNTTALVTCEWTTETGQGNIIQHLVVIPKIQNVNGSVAYDARQKTQITGFNLKGYGSITGAQTAIPSVGDPCPQSNSAAVVTAVQVDEGSTGAFSAVYGGNPVVLVQY